LSRHAAYHHRHVDARVYHSRHVDTMLMMLISPARRCLSLFDFQRDMPTFDICSCFYDATLLRALMSRCFFAAMPFSLFRLSLGLFFDTAISPYDTPLF